MPRFECKINKILLILISFSFLLFFGGQNCPAEKSPDSTAKFYQAKTIINIDSIKLSESSQYDMYCDYSGNLFILLEDQNSILKLSEKGALVEHIGGFGFGIRQFNAPVAMASPDGGLNLYILDSENRRVVRLTNSLKWIDQFQIGDEPGGKTIGELTGIAINSQKEIFISDPRNLRILKFNQNGRFLEEIEGRSKFIEPGEIVIDDEGYLYVTGRNGEDLFLFDDLGNYLKRYSPKDDDSITAIAVDRSYFYYLDSKSNSVKVFSKKLSYLFEIKPRINGDSEVVPAEIAAGRRGRILLLDINNNRIYGYDPVEK
ncbi:MAG: hypothetical protein GWO41_16475 [candidate division Zixibacteria bacterium]|nr:hypothetical protein [candidate division Zixibacteria bacterium]NIR64370.1 hypothetical protein [candidate division Zixibacteria bacterium]NIS18005.1 hypothetical protein [candidate division Zixibacteria bacterium]NIT54288.1 hypothetical protein [candidate division Zixibacteria bacterium]NIU16094.1 hypothetical protein [candidate division Zixibacteria bacterium]